MLADSREAVKTLKKFGGVLNSPCGARALARFNAYLQGHLEAA